MVNFVNTDKIKQRNMRDYYNHSDYYSYNQKNFAEKQTRFNRYIINNVLSIYLPKKNEKVLDMGCGWGNISLELQKRGYDVIGLDYSKKSVALCKKSAKELRLDPSKFVCRDAINTNFGANHFDVIYCSDLVEHLYPTIFVDLLKETHRILKRGGKLIIFTPCPSHLFEILRKYNILLKRDITHVDIKKIQVIKKCLNDFNFEVVRSYHIGSHLPLIGILENIFKKVIPMCRRRIAVLAIKK